MCRILWRHKQESARSKLNKLTVEHNHNVVFYLNIKIADKPFKHMTETLEINSIDICRIHRGKTTGAFVS